MKFIYLIPLIAVFAKASAQDVLYATSGDKIPAKVVSITADKIKYKNPQNSTSPDYLKSLNNILFAFNSTGSYLVFSDKSPLGEDEKATFISETPATKSADILVYKTGAVTTVNITAVKDASVTISLKGKPKVIQKSLLIFMIRKDGSHELFVDADKAVDFLVNAKAKINLLTGRSAITQVVAPSGTQIAVKTPVPAVTPASDAELTVDPKQFEDKAKVKVKQFNDYVNSIYNSGSAREAGNRAIDLAVGLFRSEDSKVEVSSVNSNTKTSLKIRFYLERMQMRGKLYDHVTVEYANINYASKFTQGADGNWYATITFVQRFSGFVDGKLQYGDKTKKNLQVVLKRYDKMENGETKKQWDVFFEDMGIVETTKV